MPRTRDRTREYTDLHGTQLSPGRYSRPLTRDISPSKNVHFPQDLIMGPNHPKRRSMSPVRSSLQQPQTVMEESNTRQSSQHERVFRTRAAKRKASDGTNETGKGQKKARARKVSKGKVNARSLAKNRSTATSASAISPSEMKVEPFQGHVDVCRELNELKTEIRKFAESFREAVEKDTVLSSLLNERNEQLLRYIGLLAMGGSNSVRDWEALLNDVSCRHALVFGIIGRALREHVFAELCFGAGKALRDKLEELQVDSFQQDGFFRVRERANEISGGSETKADKLELENAIATMVTKIKQLLLPFWEQGSTAKDWELNRRSTQLAKIIEMAASLSRKMKMDSNTVYDWPPTMKDEEFEPERMECYNLRAMLNDSPYVVENIKGVDRSILQAGNENKTEAIVRIICFPGLVAHRQGAGDFVSHKDRHKKDQGFRTAVLGKSVVLLQWGTQRVLTREAGTSKHILAMKNGDMSRYTDSEQKFKGLFDLYLQHKAGKDVFDESPQ